MKSLEERVSELERKINGAAVSKNAISISGNWTQNNSSANFRDDISLDAIKSVNPQEYASIFAACGNAERIKVVIALLDGPKTVKGLMEQVDFNTTGKAYHHLNFLEKAGFVEKRGNGYALKSSRVSALLTLLGGAKAVLRKMQEN